MMTLRDFGDVRPLDDLQGSRTTGRVQGENCAPSDRADAPDSPRA